MTSDSKTAIWLSYSSISDYLRCPRSYFLKNVYHDPVTGKKIKLVTPSLSLGQVVHEVLENLSKLKVEDRFTEPLFNRFEERWQKVSGKPGGFFSLSTEQEYKKRGQDMLTRVTKNPGPLKKLAVKLAVDLPHYFLSEEDNLILCGKIDWLEYFPEIDSVGIVDFKTSKYAEDPASLQLPIYHLIAHNCQKRPIKEVSYWYLETNDFSEKQPLPDLVEFSVQILKIAKDIKLARTLGRLVCPNGDKGCKYCKPYEDVLVDKAELVNSDNRYSYYAFNNSSLEPFESEIL